MTLLLRAAAASSGVDLGGWAGIVMVIIALALAVAGAFGVVAKAGLARETISLEKRHSDALQVRITELERDIAEKSRLIEAQDARIKVLEDLASGTKAIEALATVLERHHAEVLDAIRTGGKP
jgi:hypothetical protein